MEASKNLTILRDNVVKLCNSRDDIIKFCGNVSDNLEYKPVIPQTQPVQSLINEITTPKFAEGKQILNSIIKTNQELRWNTTYSVKEVGIDFMERYGWVDLIGPYGPFVMKDRRIMIGYWGEGLDYQMHWHVAEEAYIPLVGSALFWSENNGTKMAGVGDIVIHKSNEKHWTKMTNGFLLALAIWKGPDLNINPMISSRDGTKTHKVKEHK